MSARDDGGPVSPDTTRNGGPAFPIPEYHVGMSLRDWFAGQALAGQLSHPDSDGDPESAALWSYKYADAMLKERAK